MRRMIFTLRLSSLALLTLLAACKREPPAPEREAMIVAVPGMGAMRCTPLGSAGPAASALPLDLPKTGSGEMQTVFGVELHANGDTLVDGKRLYSDDALLAQARDAITQNPNLRAVIRADATVPHGRVIRALDLLKQAGISKIAFGVAPSPPEGGAAPPKP